MLNARFDSDLFHRTYPDTRAFIKLTVIQIGCQPGKTKHVGGKDRRVNGKSLQAFQLAPLCPGAWVGDDYTFAVCGPRRVGLPPRFRRA